MFMHPAVATAIADQHRRDLIAQADADRLARTASQGHARRPASPSRTAKCVIATAAAACAVAAVLMLTPAGPAHASAHVFAVPTVAGHMHHSGHVF